MKDVLDDYFNMLETAGEREPEPFEKEPLPKYASEIINPKTKIDPHSRIMGRDNKRENFGDMMLHLFRNANPLDPQEITLEMFTKKMIQMGFEGDSTAMRFILQNLPSPKDVDEEVEFELYDISKERENENKTD